MAAVSRNGAAHFAVLTRKNLEYMERARTNSKEDVHIVTQIVSSLIGLVVFPVERGFLKTVRKEKLMSLVNQGWPKWNETKGRSKNLAELLRHLRNAIAHGHLVFCSDDPDPQMVNIVFEDWKDGAVEPYWRADIFASQLLAFCLKLVDTIKEETA